VPRYYFDVYDDVIAKDDEGMELPNIAAARLNAIAGARDIIAAQVRHGYLVRSHWIEVRDEAGETVLTLPFRETVDIKE